MIKAISLRKKLELLVHKAIKTSFPLDDVPKILANNNRNEIENYDYYTYIPKQLFEKYKTDNHFFGLFTVKEVGNDIKIQIPKNDIISKAEASGNGFLKISIDDKYILNNLKIPYSNGSSLNRELLLIGPTFVTDQKLEYDYYRGLNILEKLIRLGEFQGYSISTYIMTQDIDTIKIQKLLNKQFPSLNTKWIKEADVVSENCHLFEEIKVFH